MKFKVENFNNLTFDNGGLLNVTHKNHQKHPADPFDLNGKTHLGIQGALAASVARQPVDDRTGCLARD